MSNNPLRLRLAPVLLAPALLVVLGAGPRDATPPASPPAALPAPEAPAAAPPSAAPPSAAGDPLLARWTPTDLQMAARATGELSVVDGCLALSTAEAPLLLVFPYGGAEWADGALRYAGRTYRLGDRLEVGGGTVERGSHRLGEGPRDIPACAVDALFLVG